MLVTYVMVAVCVVGVLGGVASVLSYDKVYGQSGSKMRVSRHSRRGRHGSRSSRQLQAVEAALAEDAAADEPTSCSTVRSHGRWRAR
jgi:hypothetical protein